MRYLRLFSNLLIGCVFLIIGISVAIIALPFRIIGFLFRVFLVSPRSFRPESEYPPRTNSEKGTYTVDCEPLDENEQKEIQDVIVQKSDFPIYTGKVDYAYEAAFTKDRRSCPRCNSGTKQYYANFIYATRITPRVMLAPAGFFCEECPTVIIDHEMIRKGVSQKFRFQGVIGIDYDDRKLPDLFQAWNGESCTYVFDEDGNILGLDSLSRRR